VAEITPNKFADMLLPTLKKIWEKRMEDEYKMVTANEVKKDLERLETYVKARLDNYTEWLELIGKKQGEILKRLVYLEERDKLLTRDLGRTMQRVTALEREHETNPRFEPGVVNDSWFSGPELGQISIREDVKGDLNVITKLDIHDVAEHVTDELLCGIFKYLGSKKDKEVIKKHIADAITSWMGGE